MTNKSILSTLNFHYELRPTDAILINTQSHSSEVFSLGRHISRRIKEILFCTGLIQFPWVRAKSLWHPTIKFW